MGEKELKSKVVESYVHGYGLPTIFCPDFAYPLSSHPREPPNDTSMEPQNSIITTSSLVFHGVSREEEERRGLRRKSKNHFTYSM